MRQSLLAILLLTVALPLSATNATVKDVGQGTFTPKNRGRLDQYAEFAATDPDSLAGAIEGDLAKAEVTTSNGSRFAFDAHPYYSVVFAATPPGADDPKIYRFLLHIKGPGTAEIVDHLPGITDFFEVFFSADPDASIDTVFSSSPVENPIQAQALKAVKLIETPLATLIGHDAMAQARVENVDEPSPPDITVTVRSVHIADPRSTVSVNTTISASPEIDRASLKTAVTKTKDTLKLTKTLISPCAEKMADTIEGALLDPQTGLRHETDDEIVDADERKALRQTVVDTAKAVLKLPLCDIDRAAPNAEARVAAITDTENAFRNLFTTDAKPLTSSDTFSDTPLSHFDLGIAAGAMLRIRGAERAKLNNDGDKAIPDPLTGVLSMAALHWHPIPFDPKTAAPTAAERGSVLLGFVVKPEPGLAAGFSWSIFRGLNVHVSHAWMLVHEARPVADPANPPKDLLRRGWARTITLGFGYNFE